MHISLNSGCKLLFYVEKDYFYCRFLNLILRLSVNIEYHKNRWLLTRILIDTHQA